MKVRGNCRRGDSIGLRLCRRLLTGLSFRRRGRRRRRDGGMPIFNRSRRRSRRRRRSGRLRVRRARLPQPIMNVEMKKEMVKATL